LASRFGFDLQVFFDFIFALQTAQPFASFAIKYPQAAHFFPAIATFT